MSGKAIAMKSLKEKWLSIVQSAEEKGEKGIGGSSIVTLCSVQVIFSRESISRPHLRPWGDLPNDVKILEKEGPAGLATRKFLRILEIGQVLMVGENENRM